MAISAARVGIVNADELEFRIRLPVVGGVRCAPLDAAAPLLALRHADGFHENDIATLA